MISFILFKDALRHAQTESYIHGYQRSNFFQLIARDLSLIVNLTLGKCFLQHNLDISKSSFLVVSVSHCFVSYQHDLSPWRSLLGLLSRTYPYVTSLQLIL